MPTGKLFFAALACVAFASLASAQEARKALVRPTPHYPQLAKRMNLTGTVKVEAVVAPDGTVKRVNVIGGHPLLISAAVDTVMEWKFEPAKTETVVALNFDFKP